MKCFFKEKERRERKLKGNEMRRKYRERSQISTTINNDVEESMYNISIFTTTISH